MTTIRVTRELLYHFERPARWQTLPAGTVLEAVGADDYTPEQQRLVLAAGAVRRVKQDDGRISCIPAEPVAVVRWPAAPDGWTTVPLNAVQPAGVPRGDGWPTGHAVVAVVETPAVVDATELDWAAWAAVAGADT